MARKMKITENEKYTSTNNDILQEQVGSFGNFRTNDEGMINTAKIQFFVYDYEEKLFFKFLAR